MFFSEEKWFTIGEFAKLHEINKKTLMWYDKIGLLKPAFVKENRYRYYTYRQSALLETILMLRELNVPIAEIRSFMENRSAGSLERLLGDKIEELDRTVEHLKRIRAVMEEKKKNMSAVRSLNLSEISVIERKEPAYLAAVSVPGDTSLETEIEMVIAETKKRGLHRLHDASYGAMIPAENLYAGKFSDYTALYIELPFPPREKGLHIQPAGKYLRAFCKGNWNRLPDRYREILQYAREKKILFSGFAYEKGINDPVIDSADDYITQIEIPIRP